MAPLGDDDTVAGTLPGTGVATADGSAQVAGRYQIVRWLGGGGMGRVYEALDVELGERVALKMLRGGLSDDALARFRREVRLTRRIQHPNVARMFDIGEHAGEKFLTMELIDGAPLTHERGRVIAWSRLHRLAIQIAEGLAAAHAVGVIHRDLKPDNVLVERGTERAVITDFGIARSADDAEVTQVGTLIGTPRYMAPEQLAGAQVDARADVFALGVMLYELATGQRPWAGDTPVALAVAQATQPPAPLVAPHVPAGFVDLAMRCLAIDPAARPTTAAEVAEALHALAGEPGRAPRSTTPPPGLSYRPTPAPTPTPPPGEQTTIAVLPFACGPDDAHLADALQEDLTDTLATGQLRVRPPGAFATASRDPLEVGRVLGVDVVVTGSLRRVPRGLRVAARLVGVTDGFQIWGHREDCGEADLFAVCERLGPAIARALSTRAAPAPRPTDPRAIDLYLRARAELRRFWGSHAQAATELLEEAVAYAPDYPPLLGALALASAQAYVKVGDPALRARAEAHVARAHAAGVGDALLGASILKLAVGDAEGAAADLGAGLARAPMSAPAHEMAARILLEVDTSADARLHFDTAIGLDPGRATLIDVDLARLDAFAGDWASADARVARLCADPDPAVAQMGGLVRSRFAVWRGDLDTGARAAQPAMTRSAAVHDPLFAFLLACHETGRVDEPRWHALLASYGDPARPRRIQVLAWQRAIEVMAALGRVDLARSGLAAAIDFGLFDVVWLERCPVLAALRADPATRPLHARLADRAGRVLAAFRAAQAPTS